LVGSTNSADAAQRRVQAFDGLEIGGSTSDAVNTSTIAPDAAQTWQ
jgi:hypothetical protein